jgi:hypothetical protein
MHSHSYRHLNYLTGCTSLLEFLNKCIRVRGIVLSIVIGCLCFVWYHYQTSLSLHQVPGHCINTQENTGAPQWFSWKSCTSIVGFNFSGFLWTPCHARTSVPWRVSSQMWLVHKTVKIWLVISVNSLNRDLFCVKWKVGWVSSVQQGALRCCYSQDSGVCSE